MNYRGFSIFHRCGEYEILIEYGVYYHAVSFDDAQRQVDEYIDRQTRRRAVA